MIPCTAEAILQKIVLAERLWLFLDYDGTLADFAPTPEDIIPDEALITLIEDLASQPDIRVTIISGRRLSHIQSLIPVPGIIKAGTYGLEHCTPDGDTIYRVDRDRIRPLLDELKEQWGLLLAGRSGFFLEDKRWTLAIHAKDAVEEEANTILGQASQQANSLLEREPNGLFLLQGGHRFLECGPKAADKKQTIKYILSTYPWDNDALLVYLGDDDKDEVAFEAIQEQGGVTIAVGNRLQHSAANCRLSSPQAVRQWLQQVIKTRKTI
jgi:trehalose 6-phosphate phosphatase